jgi:hypothetical protein
MRKEYQEGISGRNMRKEERTNMRKEYKERIQGTNVRKEYEEGIQGRKKEPGSSSRSHSLPPTKRRRGKWVVRILKEGREEGSV